jgi:hypothetical protein
MIMIYLFWVEETWELQEYLHQHKLDYPVPASLGKPGSWKFVNLSVALKSNVTGH